MNKPVALALLMSLFACLAASAQNAPASGVKRAPAVRAAMPCAASAANCPQGLDQSAQQQQRMQQQMDRRSKAQQTMSNTMKKQADTQGAIASNVK